MRASAMPWLCLLSPAVIALAEPANPSQDVPADWLTKAELTNFEETPRYEETVKYLKRLADHSDWIELSSCGISPMGISSTSQ